jgi:hypothetical protein
VNATVPSAARLALSRISTRAEPSPATCNAASSGAPLLLLSGRLARLARLGSVERSFSEQRSHLRFVNRNQNSTRNADRLDSTQWAAATTTARRARADLSTRP